MLWISLACAYPSHASHAKTWLGSSVTSRLNVSVKLTRDVMTRSLIVAMLLLQDTRGLITHVPPTGKVGQLLQVGDEFAAGAKISTRDDREARARPSASSKYLDDDELYGSDAKAAAKAEHDGAKPGREGKPQSGSKS